MPRGNFDTTLQAFGALPLPRQNVVDSGHSEFTANQQLYLVGKRRPEEKTPMVIEASLTTGQFIRISLLRHIHRPHFFFFAATCSVVTAYAIYADRLIFLLVAWVPFVIYLAVGITGIIQSSTATNRPYLLKTRYELSNRGIVVSNQQGESMLEWKHFSDSKLMLGCYVLFLAAGPMLAIPQSAIAPERVEQFEKMLEKYIPA